MADMDRDTFDLDGFFDAARRTTPEPSEAVMARVLSQALEVQQISAPTVERVEKPGSVFRAILDLLGGWPSVAGLATAGVAGLWFGINPPVAVSDVALAYLGGDSYALEMAPALDLASADIGLGG